MPSAMNSFTNHCLILRKKHFLGRTFYGLYGYDLKINTKAQTCLMHVHLVNPEKKCPN